MEDSSAGKRFPHMQQLWSGSSAVPGYLLMVPFFGLLFWSTFRFWTTVIFGMLFLKAFALRIESSCCSSGLHQMQMPKHRSTRALLTTQEMLKRDMPLEKIRAIVARGGRPFECHCSNFCSSPLFVRARDWSRWYAANSPKFAASYYWWARTVAPFFILTFFCPQTDRCCFIVMLRVHATYIYIYIYNMNMCLYVNILNKYIYMCVCVFYMYICIYIYICVYIYIYLFIYVNTYTFICIF